MPEEITFKIGDKVKHTLSDHYMVVISISTGETFPFCCEWFNTRFERQSQWFRGEVLSRV